MFNRRRALIQKSQIAKEAGLHAIMREGYRAFKTNGQNPYKPGTKEDALWYTGFVMAKNDAVLPIPNDDPIDPEFMEALDAIPVHIPKIKRGTTPKADLEASVIKECLAWLKQHGIFAWRNNTGSFPMSNGGFIKFGKVGSPDIIGIMPNGKFLGVECKRRDGKGRQTQEQKDFEDHIVEDNGVYLVAQSSKDLEVLI